MWQSVLIMFIAMSLIPAGDIAGKFLTGSIGASPIYVAWSRFTIGAILVIPFLPSGTLALFRDWRIWFRGAILAAGITSIQFALKTEPIADVFAAFFIAPIISYILSILFLGERVTPLRTVLICLGFAGVLLVVRPGFGGSVYLLYAVMAGSFYGVFLTSSRWLGNVAHPLSLAFPQMVIALRRDTGTGPHIRDRTTDRCLSTLFHARKPAADLRIPQNRGDIACTIGLLPTAGGNDFRLHLYGRPT
jgi:drug/metabolite transporter (DMT)-like permease